MSARLLIVALLALLTMSGAVREARAERLIVSVSNHRVTVTSSYSGEELVLFGAVEKDAATPQASRSYDLVVTISGPRADMMTRRKERRFGIWMNTDYRQFLQVPTYFALFSKRPFDDIASPEVARRQQLGLNNVLLTQRIGPDYADVVPNDAFRSAFVRLQRQHGLYREDTSAVTFITPTLFRSDAHRDRLRDRQGRLRAIRRLHSAAERPALRPRHRRHGADDGLDCVTGVREGLRPHTPSSAY
jgi:uncharacterized protein (TIGR02186 family)